MKNAEPNGIFDLFIVGGGINGAGIARDAAGRGLSVALCEMNDFASGTSSASTKLIHGGLRYLEQYEFRLVKEALAEREVLLKLAPHIIWPRDFILPKMPGMRPAWMIRLGLLLYDYLSSNRSLPASRTIRLDRHMEGQALQDRITQAFVYSDCCVDDARLVILNLISAAEMGTTILPRIQYIGARRVDAYWEVSTRDVRTGNLNTFKSKTIINAAGPWVKQVMQASSLKKNATDIRLVKGSHIVIPRKYDGEHAYIFQNKDKRIIFAIPYEKKFTLIGTTDVAIDGAAGAVNISSEEIDYLCKSSGEYFKTPINPDDVIWTYAGIRPLYDDGSGNLSTVTRDYTFEIDDQHGQLPFMTVLGGKLTTYRRLAEKALDKFKPYFSGLSSSWTATSSLPGGDITTDSFQEFLNSLYIEFSHLPRDITEGMARRHGARIYKVLSGVQSLKDLGIHFGAGLTEREVEYLIKDEWATSVDDILWRRTKVGLSMTPEQREELNNYINAKTLT